MSEFEEDGVTEAHEAGLALIATMMKLREAIGTKPHSEKSKEEVLMDREALLVIESPYSNNDLSVVKSMGLSYSSVDASLAQKKPAPLSSKNAKKRSNNKKKGSKKKARPKLENNPSKHVVVLTHHTRSPWQLWPKRVYRNHLHKNHAHKPDGLWLSDDEATMNWTKWCEKEDFRLEKLQVKTEVLVDLSDNVFLLDGSNVASVEAFHRRFARGKMDVNWHAVAAQYKGILISPYDRRCFDFLDKHHHMFWFSMWDCASACIWDLSCVQQKKAPLGANKNVANV